MAQNLFAAWHHVTLIALFGAVGAVGRYALSGWAYRGLGTAFPYGTLFVNLIGCFLLGIVFHVGQSTDLIPPHYRQALSIGTLGAFTTFSTFGLETLQQLQSGQWRHGLLNIALNVVVGLFAVWLGIQTGRQFVGGA
jgi:CrcB protein